MTMREIDGVRPDRPPNPWVADAPEALGRATASEGPCVGRGAIVRAADDEVLAGRRAAVAEVRP